jgi:glutathione S-transferase
MAAARAEIATAFDELHKATEATGYLVGDRFTLADLSAAAVLAHLVLPDEYPYRLWDPDEVQPALRAFRERLSGHPAFGWVQRMYRLHRLPTP